VYIILHIEIPPTAAGGFTTFINNFAKAPHSCLLAETGWQNGSWIYQASNIRTKCTINIHPYSGLISINNSQFVTVSA
jgi:hypothetical protein